MKTGISTLEAVGIVVALGLIVIPEPITSAAGTVAGVGILTSIVGKQAYQAANRKGKGTCKR